MAGKQKESLPFGISKLAGPEFSFHYLALPKSSIANNCPLPSATPMPTESMSPSSMLPRCWGDFMKLNGDWVWSQICFLCNQKTPNSFEVRELGNGDSSVMSAFGTGLVDWSRFLD